MRLSTLIFFFTLFLMGCTPKGTQTNSTTTVAVEQEQPSIQNIGTAQFKQLMAEGDVVILDVRTPREVAAGKIEGALEINVNGDQFDTKIQQLDKEKTYLVYCKAGGRSARACKKMEAQGFNALYNLEGGYDAWVKEK